MDSSWGRMLGVIAPTKEKRKRNRPMTAAQRQKLLGLYTKNELSYQQIADEMGMTVSAVNACIYRKGWKVFRRPRKPRPIENRWRAIAESDRARILVDARNGVPYADLERKYGYRAQIINEFALANNVRRYRYRIPKSRLNETL